MGQIVSDVTSIIDNKNAKDEAEQQRKQILEDIAADEIEKTNLVNKNLAAQKAKSGASGVAGQSLTTEAVLERLREETEQPFDEKKKDNLQKLQSTKAKTTNVLTSLLSRIDDLFG